MKNHLFVIWLFYRLYWMPCMHLKFCLSNTFLLKLAWWQERKRKACTQLLPECARISGWSAYIIDYKLEPRPCLNCHVSLVPPWRLVLLPINLVSKLYFALLYCGVFRCGHNVCIVLFLVCLIHLHPVWHLQSALTFTRVCSLRSAFCAVLIVIVIHVN